MIYYKPVKTTINETYPAKIIIDVVVKDYSFIKWIFYDWGPPFFSKF